MLYTRHKELVRRVIAAYRSTGLEPCRFIFSDGKDRSCAVGALAVSSRRRFPVGILEVKDLTGLSSGEAVQFIHGFDGTFRHNSSANRAGRLCAWLAFRAINTPVPHPVYKDRFVPEPVGAF